MSRVLSRRMHQPLALIDRRRLAKMLGHTCGRHYSVCHAAKARRSPARPSTSIIDVKPFELILSDIFGPLSAACVGSRYLIQFTEYVTRYAVAACMEHRDHSGARLQDYLQFVSSSAKPIPSHIVMRTENDTVYGYMAFEAVCKAHNISQEFTASYRHAQSVLALGITISSLHCFRTASATTS